MDDAAEVHADRAKKGQSRPSPISVTFDAVISGLNAIGTIWVFVIMVALNADVIGRYFFNAPIPRRAAPNRIVGRCTDFLAAACDSAGRASYPI